MEHASSLLTPFQQDIVAECVEKGNGGLSLPMGTGKTMISIIVSSLLKEEEDKILVVASKSLIQEWVNELEDKFEYPYEVLHSDYVRTMAEWKPKRKVVILTTPQVMAKAYTECNVGPRFTYTTREGFAPEIRHYRRPTEPYLNHRLGLGVLYSIKWGSLIIDEAQDYQNIESKRCRAISSISTKSRWLLSGTLFQEPRPPKIFAYSIMLDHPGYPKNLPEFKKFIESARFKGLKQTLVHREKNVDFNVPEVVVDVVSHPFTEEEAVIYMSTKKILTRMSKEADRMRRIGDDEMARRFSSYILAMISYLRQVIICPILPITSIAMDVVDTNERSDLSEIFMEEIDSLGLNEWLEDIENLRSSRIRAIVEKLEEDIDRKVIIYSCFRRVLEMIGYAIDGREIFTISGNMKIQRRREIIDEFAESPNGVLLLTYDIGANGLNLQFANTVYISDYWWNAGKTDQSIARVLRFGQKSKLVTVRYFTANSGIENAIFEMQMSKKKIAEQMMTGIAKQKIKKISTKEIIKMMDINDNISILHKIIE